MKENVIIQQLVLTERGKGSHKEDKTVLSYEPYVAITLSLVDIKSSYCAKLQETIKASNTWSKAPSQTARKTARNCQR